MPQFEQIDTYIGQIFWLIIFFSSLFLLLRFVFVPRLNDLVERRAQRISTLIEQAGIHQSEAKSLNEKTNQEIDFARHEARKTIEKAREIIKEEDSKMQAKLDAKVNKRLDDAESKLLLMRKQQGDEIESLARDVAISIAKSVIEKNGKDANLEKSIEKTINSTKH